MFLVDEMLGELARWLRLLGYDTRYLKDVTDQELIEYSKREKRVLLTCDQELDRRAVKEGASSFLLRPDSLVNRLATLAKTYGLDLSLSPTNSRCPTCNGKVREISDMAELKGRVPSKVQERNQEFWICTNCKKVYWVGGHWRRITKTINEVRELLVQRP
jgi:uncharacterized protein with PIN domain